MNCVKAASGAEAANCVAIACKTIVAAMILVFSDISISRRPDIPVRQQAAKVEIAGFCFCKTEIFFQRGIDKPKRARHAGEVICPLSSHTGSWGECRFAHPGQSKPGRGTRFISVRTKPPSTVISSPFTYDDR